MRYIDPKDMTISFEDRIWCLKNWNTQDHYGNAFRVRRRHRTFNRTF